MSIMYGIALSSMQCIGHALIAVYPAQGVQKIWVMPQMLHCIHLTQLQYAAKKFWHPCVILSLKNDTHASSVKPCSLYCLAVVRRSYMRHMRPARPRGTGISCRPQFQEMVLACWQHGFNGYICLLWHTPWLTCTAQKLSEGAKQ